MSERCFEASNLRRLQNVDLVAVSIIAQHFNPLFFFELGDLVLLIAAFVNVLNHFERAHVSYDCDIEEVAYLVEESIFSFLRFDVLAGDENSIILCMFTGPRKLIVDQFDG